MATQAGYQGTYWITPAERLFLHRLLAAVPGDYLEIGSFDGIVATELAVTFPDRQVHCVDWFQGGHATEGGHREVFAANVAAHGAGNLRIFEGDSRRVVPGLTPGYGLIFVDGDHAYATVRADLENAWAKLDPGGLLAFHDYGAVDDVTRAADDFRRDHALSLALRVDSIGCVAGPQFPAAERMRLRRWVRVNLRLHRAGRRLRRMLGLAPGG
jgi:predicted O-methyltransferase YrrM